MGILYLIGLILCFITFLLSRKLYEKEGYSRNLKLTNKIKFPIIAYIGFIVASFIPILNLIISLTLIIMIIIMCNDSYSDVGYKSGNFIKFLNKKL